MASKMDTQYAIKRIRMINFHNFVNETIDIPDGGHLFLLGDNASGKTTVLDAIHYVLTAGESMEFNSAARIAGSKAGGRRVQGIIMRYDLEKGPLNPNGGISYACLEITGRLGKPVTLAIGMAATSMQDPVRRWGIIRECSLEDISFLIQDDSGERPRSSQEMKTYFGSKSGFYQHINQYKKELASRFFDNEDIFNETCRLLNMGKAYRDIVYHSSDYHQLFKKLLPEPKSDLLGKVVDSLRTLENSQEHLNRMQDKLKYLHLMRQTVQKVEHFQEKIYQCQWLSSQCTIEAVNDRLGRNQANQKAVRKEQSRVEKNLMHRQNRQQRLGEQLHDLELKDSAGLVRQQKDLQNELKRRQEQAHDMNQKLVDIKKQTKQKHSILHKNEQYLRDQLINFYKRLTKIGVDLPFSITDFSNQIDLAYRAEIPENGLSAPDLKLPALRQLEYQAHTQLIQSKNNQEHIIDDLNQQLRTLTNEIDSLKNQKETLPPIANYSQVLLNLQKLMIPVMPLYKGLEWGPNLSNKAISTIEEFIGPDILGILLIHADHAQHAKAAIFENHPGIRIAIRSKLTADLPQWIRDHFDIPGSDPDALRYLALETESQRGPDIYDFKTFDILKFRSHERRLLGRPLVLIASKRRREALMDLVKQKEKVQNDIKRRIRQEERIVVQSEKQLMQLNQFRQLLDDHVEQIFNFSHQIRQFRQDYADRLAQQARYQKQSNDIKKEIDHLVQRLTNITNQIKKAGLDTLEQNIQDLRKKIDAHRNKENQLSHEKGGLTNQRQQLLKEQLELEKKIEDQQTTAQSMIQKIQALHPDIDPIEAYIFSQNKALDIHSKDKIDAARIEARDIQNQCMGQIDNKISHPLYGTVFNFVYEKETNQLHDHRGVDITELASAHSQNIEDQEQVINEKTTEIFHQIIFHELIQYFRSQISIFNKMIHQINDWLKNRPFGNSYYRFDITENTEFGRLLRIIKDFTPFDRQEGEKRLKNFLEDYKEDLFATEVGEVPEIFDYRNWYQYNMRIMTRNKEGVIMDSRIKSIGSGGEQAVPNYLLIITVAHFMYKGNKLKLQPLIFDEAFYGIDSGRRDQLLGFATDLQLQLFVASPDQDGVKQEIKNSTSIMVIKDPECNVHLYPFHWKTASQLDLFEPASDRSLEFGAELES